ncbi:hypothetical protein Tco_0577277, partial [Tanacetum coccineum]
SSFGTLVETSMDGPAGLVFGPDGAALGPAELAQKTPNTNTDFYKLGLLKEVSIPVFSAR